MFSLVGSVANAIIFVLTTIGLAGLFALMVVESFGIPPIPSEVILPFTGFLIATGVFPLVPAIGVAIAGAIVGAFIAYAVGYWWRERITGIGVGPFRLEERHLARVDRWFATHGEATVGICRVIPVVRAYISYPAGTARMSPVRFGVFTLIGTTPYALGLIYAGFVLRAHWTVIEREFVYIDYLLLALIVAAAVYVLVLFVAWTRRDRGDFPPSPAGSESPPGPPPAPPAGGA